MQLDLFNSVFFITRSHPRRARQVLHLNVLREYELSKKQSPKGKKQNSSDLDLLSTTPMESLAVMVVSAGSATNTRLSPSLVMTEDSGDLTPGTEYSGLVELN